MESTQETRGICYREGCEGGWPTPQLYASTPISARNKTPGWSRKLGPGSPTMLLGAPTLLHLTGPVIQRLLSKCSFPSLFRADCGACLPPVPRILCLAAFGHQLCRTYSKWLMIISGATPVSPSPLLNALDNLSPFTTRHHYHVLDRVAEVGKKASQGAIPTTH